MKIVIAIDSFKGSLTSLEAGGAAAKGIRRVCPEADIAVRPVADGGEGTVDALREGMNGICEEITVSGPLGEPVQAAYAVLQDGKTAIIEMSAAAGLPLVPADKRNPLHTTTYGVGEMIAHAIRRGCRNFIIGIGGSATNDGGVGMLQALGFGFFDVDGQPIPRGAAGLARLARITDDCVMPQLEECRFHIACDVTNPLCGENGCSAVYGPQKGADAVMIAEMDRTLRRYAMLVKTVRPSADAEYPGAGAAGGMGFAFSAFLGGKLENGIGLILRETALENYVRDADIVITGEGRLDAQTAMGKAPAGVAAIAKRYGKPVIAFSGCVTREASACHGCGIDAYFPIVRAAVSLEDAMRRENAMTNLSDAAEQAFRLIRAFYRQEV